MVTHLMEKFYYIKQKTLLFRSESRLIVGLGVEDLIVVETNDVMLVANKKKSQDIKKIVNKLKENGVSEVMNTKIYRPWGQYISVLEELRWKVKVIIVKPGQTLSLQMHHHRSEHWVVVNGTAKVEIDGKKIILHENQSSYIPLGTKHRLSNPGKIPLKLIEVQSGSYVGEDDIKRFEDNYGRVRINEYGKYRFSDLYQKKIFKFIYLKIIKIHLENENKKYMLYRGRICRWSNDGSDCR